MLVYLLYISFGEVFIQELSHLFHWVVCFLINEYQDFFVYFGYNSFIRYLFYRYFLPVCGFLFSFS